MTGPVHDTDAVVVRDGVTERLVPVDGWLIVGRQCLGVDEAHRLIIDRADVSRSHLEIRLEPERNRAIVIDLSTNGTRLNGARLGRAIPVDIKAGDRLELAGVELEFRSQRFTHVTPPTLSVTRVAVSASDMVLLAGDVVGYSTTSQHADTERLALGMGHLFDQLLRLLAGYGGVFANHAGDAFFAIWEPEAVPHAAERAIEFALAATERVRELAPELGFAPPDGQPLRMGWGVVRGQVALGSMAGALLTVVGDATNLAFRLSGLAARDGRQAVLVSPAVREAAGERFAFTVAEQVTVKGRSGLEIIYGVVKT
jgi:class 3 adenylate cyclase